MMFRRSFGLAVLIAGAALAPAAFAADNLPAIIKAPAAATFAPCAVATATTPLSCSGFYVGAGISGQGSNANVIGNGINGSVFAGGMVPSVDAGYQHVQGNWLFGAEVALGYGMGSSISVNGAAATINGLRATEFFKVGGNLSAMLGTQAPITIPPQLVNAVLGPYVGIGSTQWKLGGTWATGTVSGAGVLFDISPRWFGDLRYTYTDFSSARAGGLTLQNDQALRFSVNYKLN